MPPSPVVSVLEPWKLNVDTRPNEPAARAGMPTAGGLGGVFDERDALLGGERFEPEEVRKPAVQIDEQDRLRPGCEHGADRLERGAPTVGLDVGEDRRGADVVDRGRSRDPGRLGHHDLVAGPDAERHQREVQPAGARREGDRMPASDRSGELRLEGSALHRGVLVPRMSRGLSDGLDFALGDPRPGDRDGSRARSDDRVVCCSSAGDRSTRARFSALG